jgi:hypothetical protein
VGATLPRCPATAQDRCRCENEKKETYSQSQRNVRCWRNASPSIFLRSADYIRPEYLHTNDRTTTSPNTKQIETNDHNDGVRPWEGSDRRARLRKKGVKDAGARPLGRGAA